MKTYGNLSLPGPRLILGIYMYKCNAAFSYDLIYSIQQAGRLRSTFLVSFTSGLDTFLSTHHTLPCSVCRDLGLLAGSYTGAGLLLFDVFVRAFRLFLDTNTDNIMSRLSG